MDGSIDVYSELNLGTRFVVSIPISAFFMGESQKLDDIENNLMAQKIQRELGQDFFNDTADVF